MEWLWLCILSLGLSGTVFLYLSVMAKKKTSYEDPKTEEGESLIDEVEDSRDEINNKVRLAERKWILVYCDLHYVHKNSAKDALLMLELAGRQMGMPSPHGDISRNYKYQ